MYRAYAADPQMRINLGIRRRLAPLLGNDRRKIELLNALLFSLPGTPVIYYGDEIGMGDNVYLGDRDGVRTPMQWTADRNAGFSTANPQRLYLPLIIEQDYHYETVNVEAQRRNPASLLSWMRQLIALRKRHRVLGRGDIEFLEPDNPQVLAFVRADAATATSAAPRAWPTCRGSPSRSSSTCAAFAGAVPVEVFGRPVRAVGDRPYSLTLAPYGFFWFAIDAGDAVADAAPSRPAAAARRLWPTCCAGGRRSAGCWPWMPEPALVRRQGGRPSRRRRRRRHRARRRRRRWPIVRTSFTEGDDHRYSVPLLHTTRRGPSDIEQMPPRAARRPARRRRASSTPWGAGGRRRRRWRGAAPAHRRGRDAVADRPPPAARADASWPTTPATSTRSASSSRTRRCSSAAG